MTCVYCQGTGRQRIGDHKYKDCPICTTPAAAVQPVGGCRQALEDLLTWFPEKPVHEWRIEAGEQGADDAIKAARAALANTPTQQAQGEALGYICATDPADLEKWRKEGGSQAGKFAYAKAIKTEHFCVPIYTTPQQAQGEAVGGLTDAIKWAEAKRDAYATEYGQVDPATGALEFTHRGEDRYIDLCDLVDELTALADPKVCTRPPAGWRCTCDPKHAGPCAALAATPLPGDAAPPQQAQVAGDADGFIHWHDDGYEIDWFKPWRGGDCNVYLGAPAPKPAAVVLSDAHDATRYRWLRQQMFVRRNGAVPDRYGLPEYLLSEGVEEPNDSKYIDAAIDAAITGAK